MTSSSGESSRSPSPVISKSKGKGKGKATKEKSTDKPQDADWAYTPPSNFKAVKDVHDAEEWDWEAFKEDKELELWLIRVPEGVKPRHLESVSIQIPSSSSKSSKVGSISRKREKYDIHEYRDDSAHQSIGEEIKNISCLLPKRTKKGELRLTPRPITRRLIVSSQGVTAKPSEIDSAIERQNPERFSYPKELLTHTFMPYGSQSHLPTPPGDDMEVDVPQTQKDEEKKKKRKKPTEDATSSSPKKAKKAKVGK
ncbi:hypothetical protein V5O48_004308 [Marasmius crinis-equi]|uniref:SHSP domain-containing protein n=1 Tax=Marasmius crinis-equi TaxID=585013 RepID=A0ABR3FQH0_9AGAR